MSESTLVPETLASFAELGLSPVLLEELQRLSYERPTPIQSAAIPVIVQGRDVIGIAQTGTGKTAAFVLPIMERLGGGGGLRALVLSPTRELTTQIHAFVEAVGGGPNFRAAEIIGGEAYGDQNRALAAQPDMVVGTPGRVLDQIESQRFPTERIQVLVLDEADRLLDMGFAPQIEAILRKLPRDRQTLLFSATMPARVKSLARTYMREPVEVAVGPQDRAVALCEQELHVCTPGDKLALLKYLLHQESGTMLVFTRTKRAADLVGRVIEKGGHSVGVLHADRRQTERRQVMEDFRAGRIRILVATDIASRGLDIDGIARVVNYDIPPTVEDYLHRIGRTARAEREGHATTFATGEDLASLRSIEGRLGERIPSKVVSKEELQEFLRADSEREAERRAARPAPRPAAPIEESGEPGTRGGTGRDSGGRDGRRRSGGGARSARGSEETQSAPRKRSDSSSRSRVRPEPERSSERPGRAEPTRAKSPPLADPLPARRKLRSAVRSRASTETTQEGGRENARTAPAREPGRRDSSDRSRQSDSRQSDSRQSDSRRSSAQRSSSRSGDSSSSSSSSRQDRSAPPSGRRESGAGRSRDDRGAPRTSSARANDRLRAEEPPPAYRDADRGSRAEEPREPRRSDGRRDPPRREDPRRDGPRPPSSRSSNDRPRRESARDGRNRSQRPRNESRYRDEDPDPNSPRASRFGSRDRSDLARSEPSRSSGRERSVERSPAREVSEPPPAGRSVRKVRARKPLFENSPSLGQTSSGSRRARRKP